MKELTLNFLYWVYVLPGIGCSRRGWRLKKRTRKFRISCLGWILPFRWSGGWAACLRPSLFGVPREVRRWLILSASTSLLRISCKTSAEHSLINLSEGLEIWFPECKIPIKELELKSGRMGIAWVDSLPKSRRWILMGGSEPSPKREWCMNFSVDNAWREWMKILFDETPFLWSEKWCLEFSFKLWKSPSTFSISRRLDLCFEMKSLPWDRFFFIRHNGENSEKTLGAQDRAAGLTE